MDQNFTISGLSFKVLRLEYLYALNKVVTDLLAVPGGWSVGTIEKVGRCERETSGVWSSHSVFDRPY